MVKDGVIAQLEGREQEYLVTNSGGLIAGFSVSIPPFIWDRVQACQIVQDRPGCLEIRVNPRANYDDAIGAALLEDLNGKWGGFFQISVRCTEDFMRTRNGKLRLIVAMGSR